MCGEINIYLYLSNQFDSLISCIFLQASHYTPPGIFFRLISFPVNPILQRSSVKMGFQVEARLVNNHPLVKSLS